MFKSEVQQEPKYLQELRDNGYAIIPNVISREKAL